MLSSGEGKLMFATCSSDISAVVAMRHVTAGESTCNLNVSRLTEIPN